MSTSLTRTWKRRIQSYQSGHPIEKAKIGAFRKLVNRPAYLPQLSPELAALIESLWIYGRSQFAWRIEPDQTEQGLRWLRMPKVYRQLGPTETAILDDFSHFLFVDVQDNSTTYRTDSAPVYRVCSHTHGWFDYTPRPWQSQGCPFEIVQNGGK